MPFLLETPGIENAAQLAAELELDFVELNMSFPACSLDRMDEGMLNSLQDEGLLTLHRGRIVIPSLEVLVNS